MAQLDKGAFRVYSEEHGFMPTVSTGMLNPGEMLIFAGDERGEVYLLVIPPGQPLQTQKLDPEEYTVDKWVEKYDKHGKPIFENDIVRSPHPVYAGAEWDRLYIVKREGDSVYYHRIPGESLECAVRVGYEPHQMSVVSSFYDWEHH